MEKMFRDIRRNKKEISLDTARNLLVIQRRGVLAVNGDNGYPYAVPVNYFYSKDENKIYFHGARVGHKADSIKCSDKVCFTVYGNETIRNESWAPFIQSVVVFGRCKMIADEELSIELVGKLAEKYYPNEKLINEEINKAGKNVQIFEIDIEHISGKEIQEK